MDCIQSTSISAGTGRHYNGAVGFWVVATACVSALLLLAPTGVFAQDLAIEWGSFLGGGLADYGWGITTGSDGSIVIVGETYSSDFPVTENAYQTSFGGDTDAYLIRLSGDGSIAFTSTLLGGVGHDVARVVVLDGDGSIYIIGVTNMDFPTTPGALFTEHQGGASDAFFAKFSPDGKQLLYSTYIGGSGYDKGRGIALLGPELVVLAGTTASWDFPVTPGCFADSNSGDKDVFVMCLDLTNNELVYSTYVGGAAEDMPWDLQLDVDGNAYVTGYTDSQNFPTTAGSIDPSWNGGRDAILFKLSSTGDNLIYSTFLGGSENDEGWRMVVNKRGEALVTGNTLSANFPSTPAAYDRTHNGHNDVFVVKASAAGDELLFATFVGGDDADLGKALAQDDYGFVHVSGSTKSVNFPIVGDVPDPSQNGQADAFLVALNPDGTELMVSTFIGGMSWEGSWGVAFTPSMDCVLTGITRSPNFPTNPGVFDNSYNGGTDGFAVRLAIGFWPAAIHDPALDVLPSMIESMDVFPCLTRGATTIRYVLAAESRVELSVHDFEGRCMSTLLQGHLGVGEHAHTWRGGRRLPPGQYVLRLATDREVRSRRVLIVH